MYGLHLLFVALVFLLLVRLLKGDNAARFFFLIAYFLGLAFTNHLQTVLLFPTLFLLLLFKWKAWRFDFRTLLGTGLLLFLGLSPYFYLSIRSSTGPLADWGATSDWDNFIRHITGWQYRVYMFGIPFEKALENSQAALRTIASQFKWPFWFFLPGIYFIRRPAWKILLAFLFYPVLTFVYNASYDIPDIDPYYLPVIFLLFLLVGLGALGWLEFLRQIKTRKETAVSVAIVLLLFLTGYSATSNWRRSDQSQNRFPQEALENIYKSAPAGGLVLSTVWNHYAPWLYNRFVLGKRPDLQMVDINLTNRSWYLDLLKRTLPEEMGGLEEKIDSMRALIRNFEEGRPLDTIKIELSYQSLLAALLRKNFDERPVYFDVVTNFDSAAGWVLVPEGALLRVYKEAGYYPYEAPPLGFSDPANPLLMENAFVREEVQALAWILALRKDYEAVFGPKSTGEDKRSRP